jgi:preprotein translocase subunit SecA
MDMYWMEHLETMEYMRGSVNLRAYGQRDPLVEYKKEGLRLFKELEYSIDENILNNIHILNGTFDEIDHEWIVDSNKPTENNGRHLIETHTSGSILSGEKKNTPKETNKDGITEKIGRNDLCPCGSGKKYKHCGYINSKDHKLK